MKQLSLFGLGRLVEGDGALGNLVSALESMSLGSSGWRKVFAAGGRPNGLGSGLSSWDVLLVLVVSDVLAQHFLRSRKEPTSQVVLARDSRPTGEAIEGLFHRVFGQKGLSVACLGVAPLPEVMAWVKSSKNLLGAAYITASHNPVGYNGLKMVGSEGEVFPSQQIDRLARQLRQCTTDLKKVREAVRLFGSAPWPLVRPSSQGRFRSASKRAYASLLRSACFVQKPPKLDRFPTEGFDVLWDYNGSARANSIDEGFLKDYGVRVKPMNAEAGKFTHKIVPEGSALNNLKRAMSLAPQATLFGVAVDCDGDRGNLVVYNGSKPIPLGAQQTFQLVAASELAFHSTRRRSRPNILITNDATSGRVPELAKLFDVEVAEAEVGEANLLALAKKKRNDGFEPILLGEGSNGGCILPPQSVRDPLAMAISILKLLFWKHKTTSFLGLMDLVAERTNKTLTTELAKLPVRERLYAFAEEVLPNYNTTPVFEPKSLLPLHSTKNLLGFRVRFLKNFAQAYDDIKDDWRRQYNFHDYDIRITTKTTSKPASLDDLNSLGDAGGLKIRFHDANGNIRGFFWMRASQTEPVLRLCVDVKGTPKDEKTLFAWLRSFCSS